MSKQDYLGKDFIGQDKLRREINFLLDGQKNDNFLDNLIFVAKRGDGKTMLCRKIAKTLGKKALEINGSSFQSVGEFVDRIVNPHISNNQDVTIFVDEIASIGPLVIEWLLSVLQYDPLTKISKAQHDGVDYFFDFKHFTFICATTNPEALSQAFLSRFRRLEFSAYSEDELVEMLYKYTPGITFTEAIEKEIVSIARSSPRALALRISDDIRKFLAQKTHDKNFFTPADWEDLCDTISINPFGLSPNEIKLLEILSEEPCTLTHLTGKFNLDAGTIRKDIELFPLAKSLFFIDGKRHITPKGLDILNRVRNRHSLRLSGVSNDSQRTLELFPEQEIDKPNDDIVNSVL